MTPWLCATALAIVVGSSTAALSQGASQSYGVGTRVVMSTAAGFSSVPVPGSVRGPGASTPWPTQSYVDATAPSTTATPAHGPLRASPSASAAPTPSSTATPTRAGSRAGEGRQRPGRPEDPEASEEVTPADTESPPPRADSGDGNDDGALTAVSEPPRYPAAVPPRPHAAQPTAAEPKVFILPLGTGLVLVGLGLGLGLLALRVRRG